MDWCSVAILARMGFGIRIDANWHYTVINWHLDMMFFFFLDSYVIVDFTVLWYARGFCWAIWTRVETIWYAMLNTLLKTRKNSYRWSIPSVQEKRRNAWKWRSKKRKSKWKAPSLQRRKKRKRQSSRKRVDGSS